MEPPRLSGLLDWRLGLSLLRCLAIPTFGAGVEGDFSYPDLVRMERPAPIRSVVDYAASWRSHSVLGVRQIFLTRSMRDMRLTSLENGKLDCIAEGLGPGRGFVSHAENVFAEKIKEDSHPCDRNRPE
jgi:hypothetical protein